MSYRSRVIQLIGEAESHAHDLAAREANWYPSSLSQTEQGTSAHRKEVHSVDSLGKYRKAPMVTMVEHVGKGCGGCLGKAGSAGGHPS